ncbi:MAG: hypothetical protein Q7R57_07685 [Dehalococcoidales bacterium]|nr:hypothetical protein [Dehalococcoidales bacterium]
MQSLLASIASVICSGILVFGGFRLESALASNNSFWWLWLIPIVIFTFFVVFMVAYYSAKYMRCRVY